MGRLRFASRIAAAASAAVIAASLLAGPTGAVAQQPPADLSVLPPVPTTYTPKRTPWGDWDFRSTWTIENIAAAHVLFERPKQFGDRFWVTDEEFAKRLASAKGSDASFSTGKDSSGNVTGVGGRGHGGPGQMDADRSVRPPHLDAGQPGRRPAAGPDALGP